MCEYSDDSFIHSFIQAMTVLTSQKKLISQVASTFSRLSSPKNAETHFKVIVVSSQFDSVKSPLQRHRLVNGTLAKELEGPVHALSIIAKSPAQWEKSQSVPASPNCQGGDGSLPKKNP
jgi:stress-induced morphogen